jgi:Restriction endonuclease
VLCGLRNAIWRTPGADAGRDIEGEFLAYDLSESVSLQRWYIECKRYSKTLDWPTAHNKLPYAINHRADFLLFVTTGHLSPRCREEISSHNAIGNRPLMRVWDSPKLENIVRRYPLLLFKYRLDSNIERLLPSVLPLVQIASKAIQTSYGHATSAGSPDPALESAAALVDLLAARLAEGQILPRKSRPRFRNEDRYQWCNIDSQIDLSGLDGYALRALLAVARFFSHSAEVSIDQFRPGQYAIDLSRPVRSGSLDSLIPIIVGWSNLSIRTLSDQRLIVSRKEDSEDGQ